MFVISKKITIFASNYNDPKSKHKELYVCFLQWENPVRAPIRKPQKCFKYLKHSGFLMGTHVYLG